MKKCRTPLDLGKSDSFNYHMIWRQGFEINVVLVWDMIKHFPDTQNPHHFYLSQASSDTKTKSST